MQLKRIEINGFKSFPEKVVIQFDEGITAVVGPNGSGKSNIADAIRWVLGEQSARVLRGAKMEDVIFAGTERRRPQNFAQVTLVLDNMDRHMSLDYDEIAISRTVYRSGESEYMINGSRCRLKDVQELLMDTGLGKDGYSIIGQGQIDQLLSNKPQDRRLIFEEASGITKYKSRKEEAEKKLLDEDGNLQRVEDRLVELQERVEPLTEEAERARVYLGIKEELKDNEVSLFLGQYSQFNEQFAKSDENLRQLDEQLSEVLLRAQNADDEVAYYARAQQEAKEAFREKDAERQELAMSASRLDGELALLGSQKETTERALAQAEANLNEVKQRLRRQMDTMDAEEKEVKALTTQIAEGEAALQEIKDAAALARGTQQEAKANWDRKSAERTEAYEALVALRTQRERYLALLENIEQEQKNWAETEKKLRADIAAAGKDKDKAVASADAAASAYNACGDEIKSLEETIRELRDRLQKKQEALTEEYNQQREIKNRIAWLGDLEKDYEGYNNSVRSLMQRKKELEAPTLTTNAQRQAQIALYKGVRGTLADLMNVPQKYAVAVEIALGGALQNIVTESETTAKALIEELRREQKGRATFLPMDKISARSLSLNKKEVLAMKGACGFADELISFKPEYKNIMSRQLGNVVVAEDFDSASAIFGRFGHDVRVVTLLGDIFNIGGAITGGSTGKVGNILSRKSEMDELKKKEEDFAKRVQKAQQQTDALVLERRTRSSEMEALNEKREELRDDWDEAKGTAQQKSFALKALEDKLEEGLANAEMLLKTRDNHAKTLDKFNADETALAAAESEKAAAEAEAKESFESATSTEQSKQAEFTAAQSELGGKRVNLRIISENLQREAEAIENFNSDADALLTDIASYKDDLKNKEREAAEKSAEKAKLDEILGAAGALSKDLESKQDEQMARWTESITKQAEINSQKSDLEKERLRLDNQRARSQTELAALQDRLWEDYQLTYNAALLLGKKDLGSAAAMKKRIATLKEQLHEMGDVNVNALVELTAITDRIQLLSTQREDILRSVDEVQALIAELQGQMEKQFNASFQRIGVLFDETFRKLFGGGHAMLKLAEGEPLLEAGIDIIAQPPGKKLQYLSLLSGGERALTAIALLFAVQSLSPAPFCILDEIEAALDEVNVTRYAGYLQELCKDTQYIVITHRKGTMEAAHMLYGVTMEEKGISKCVSVSFENREH